MLKNNYKGFTLMELLVVIAIIGILSSVVLGSLNSARASALEARAHGQFKTFQTALELYKNDNAGEYPPDSDRDLPSGMEAYIAGGVWPEGPWPGSVYDWDNWEDPDVSGARIYQISVRFCPTGGPLSACVFPDEDWAEDFDIDSAYYFCISGNCRSHASQPVEYPGKCVNCAEE